MRRRDQPAQLQVDALEDAFGDVTISFGGLGGLNASPLSLLSPNSAPLQPRGSPARTAKATGPTAAAESPSASAVIGTTAATVAPTSPALPEENDPLGDLPQFRRRPAGNGGTARRRPDARRQSMAIGAMFAGLTQHAEGLLGDSELAVGDEEVQVPLAKSGKLLGGAANQSSLFVDPDTADLLATQLPSPQLLSPGPMGSSGPSADAGAQATPTPPPRHLPAAAQKAAAEQPAECDSPRIAPALLAMAASARKTPGGMRESVSVFGDLTFACESMGLNDYDGDDFQLQESNKVKELAMLYKASATPRSTAPGQAQRADPSVRHSACDSLRASVDGGQHRSVQSPTAASGTQETQFERLQQPEFAAGPAQQQQQQGEEVNSSGPSRAAPAPAHSAPAAKPAGSRLPAPPARASRLRAPTTSSGYFSTAATNNIRTGPRPAAAAAGTARPATATSRPAAGTRPTAVAGAGPAAKPVERPGSAGAAKQPAQGGSRIPSSSKPTASTAVAPGTRLQHHGTATTAVTPRRPAPAASAAIAGTPSASQVPAQHMSSPPAAAASAGSAAAATLTPNTARLRWLEQNPELAFGGGTKLAVSPAKRQAGAQPRKLTAEERHALEWGDHL